ncbi:MAG: AMP-binding protein [Hyphomicrobiaceae bacterium]
MNLIASFLTEAEKRTNQIAIIHRKGKAITFADLVSRSANLAGAWRGMGVQAGDRVLLAMGLGIDLYVALAAAWRIGAVVVFPEPALGVRGLRHAVRATRPKAFLSSGLYRVLGWVLPELRQVSLRLTPFDYGSGPSQVEEVVAEHIGLISFTSGSTGTPKAIARSHGFLAAQNACVADLLAPGKQREVDLVAFPVFVIANMSLGVTSVLPNWNLKRQDKADPVAIAAHMRRCGVTRALLPPSICERLCQLEELPSLTAIFTGGGPVFPDVTEKLARLLPNADIIAVYGSTEAEPIAHLHVHDITEDDWAAMRSGSGLLAGTPIPEIALKLHDDEIVVSGDHVNKGYLDSRDDTDNKIRIDEEIWHRTGDAGRLDEKGRLWLLGRHEARVHGLYPFAVEVAARSWPGVIRTALINLSGRAVLAIEGEPANLEAWQENSRIFDDITVVAVSAIPLDQRHRSKVDYAKLTRQLQAMSNA